MEKTPLTYRLCHVDFSSAQFPGMAVFDVESGIGIFNNVSQGSHQFTAEVHFIGYDGGNLKHNIQ